MLVSDDCFVLLTFSSYNVYHVYHLSIHSLGFASWALLEAQCCLCKHANTSVVPVLGSLAFGGTNV